MRWRKLIWLICLVFTSCTNVTDIAFGKWQGTERLFVFDEEQDPVWYNANVILELNSDHTYSLDLTFSDYKLYDETKNFEPSHYTNSWTRSNKRISLNDLGLFTIEYLSDTELYIKGPWPCYGLQLIDNSENYTDHTSEPIFHLERK